MHKTRGIVLRTVKYGDASIITTIYTELFGIQSYIVKGVRQSTKKSQGKAGYFQPAAILDLEVYHNELKNLQFIKEFQWGVIYQQLLFDVVRNAVAQYIIELLQHSLKQPEANPELFYLIEKALLLIDEQSSAAVANIPAWFTLQLASQLGFQIQGAYSNQTPVLDLKEGFFTTEIPLHPFYVTGEAASVTSTLNQIIDETALEKVGLNRNTRQELLQAYHQFMNLHIADFGEMRSLTVLQAVLS